MRNTLVLLLPALVLCACAHNPPTREPGWWAGYVTENRPNPDDQGMFYGQGEAARDLELANQPLEFKWLQHTNGRVNWVIHVRADGTGYAIVDEHWIDGAIPRGMRRKLELRLTADEQQKARQAVQETGVLGLRSSYGGGGEPTWHLGLRVGERLAASTMDGGYPGEARRFAQDMWDLLVVPHAEELAKAPRFEPEDFLTAPEFQPLK